MWIFKTKIGRIILGSTTAIVLLVIVFIVAGSKADSIVTAYNNLSGRPSNSKYQYAAMKKVIRSKTNVDGSIEFVTSSAVDDIDPDGIYDYDPGTPDNEEDTGFYDGEEGFDDDRTDCIADNHSIVCTDDKTCLNGGIKYSSTEVNFTYPFDIYYNVNNSGSKVYNCVSGDYGIAALFKPNEYINFSWSSSSKQREICDYILKHKNDYDISNEFATFKGYPLMAMAPYFASKIESDIGKIIEITYLVDATDSNSAKESFDVIIVDIKGDETLEYSQAHDYDNVGSYDVKTGKHTGHFMYKTYRICITELVGNSGDSSLFRTQFKNNYNRNSRVVKVKDTGKTIYDIK